MIVAELCSSWALIVDMIAAIGAARKIPAANGGSDLNLLYPDTIRKLGIDLTKIRYSRTSFKGVTPGPYAKCTGSLLLEVVFGSPDNFPRERLIFHVAPFKSSYQALLGCEAFVRFNAIPHYSSLTPKMPGARGIISLKGRSKTPDTARQVRHK